MDKHRKIAHCASLVCENQISIVLIVSWQSQPHSMAESLLGAQSVVLPPELKRPSSALQRLLASTLNQRLELLPRLAPGTGILGLHFRCTVERPAAILVPVALSDAVNRLS